MSFSSPNPLASPTRKECDYLFKVVMVGDSAVGKSSLLVSLVKQTFVEGYSATIGIDYRIHNLLIDDKKVRLHIWDTAGQERFRTLSRSYYRNADAVLILFDLTHKETFESAGKYWLTEARDFADHHAIVVLVGNKADGVGEERRVAAEEEVRAFGEGNKLPYRLLSAKTGDNVLASFEWLARQMIVAAPSKPPPEVLSPHRDVVPALPPDPQQQLNRQRGCCS